MLWNCSLGQLYNCIGAQAHSGFGFDSMSNTYLTKRVIEKVTFVPICILRSLCVSFLHKEHWDNHFGTGWNWAGILEVWHRLELGLSLVTLVKHFNIKVIILVV